MKTTILFVVLLASATFARPQSGLPFLLIWPTAGLRFGVSSDAAIYDSPTSNWKLTLVANDIAGGIRELRQGHEPWED
jgi:hypothetical protein